MLNSLGWVNNMIRLRLITYKIMALVLFGIFSSCNFSNEEDGGGGGGIQVNQGLYSEVRVRIGDTLCRDLVGDPPVCFYPNDVPLTLWDVNGKDAGVSEVKF